PYPTGPIDHLPNAVNDTASTAYNTAVVVDALVNDTLGDAPTTVSAYDAVSAHGGAVAFVDGKFNYTPAADWSGTDTFAYTIRDADGDVDSATVSVTVGVAPPSPSPEPTPGVTLTGTWGGDVLTGGNGDDTIN